MRLLISLLALSLICSNCYAENLNSELIAIQTIMLEAQGESLVGQIAVGEVIRNRANKDHKSILEICTAPFQFSCWNSAVKAQKRLDKASGEVYQRAFKAWELSKETNYTHGANYYVAKKELKYLPKWIDNLEEVAVIGNHTFYKEK